jgi:hypothetical protein
MLTKAFGLDALERAIKTFAQSLLALITVGSAITSIDWVGSCAVAATAAVISLLTSVVSLPLGDSGTASVIKTDASG